MKLKLLLHACCGPCSLYVISKLIADYDVCVYFYNPNIHPLDEYLKRKETIANYCKKNKIKFVEDVYDDKLWREKTKGLEHEAEKGKRCLVCFDLRLRKAAHYAKKNGYDVFATTLTISPYKHSPTINAIGKKAASDAGIVFLDKDWAKEDGFKITMQMARAQAFYLQKYCGCEFSKNKLNIKKKQ